MNTSKAISTVGYNTKDFLDMALKELMDSRIISFYAYLYHEPEPKESGDIDTKRHFHMYIEPNKRIDTMELQDKLKEFDPMNPKPLGTRPFQHTKLFGDWYFYTIHDPLYLASKGLTRFYTYSKEEIDTSDRDYLEDKIFNAILEANKINHWVDIGNYQAKGFNFMQYVVARNIHPMQYEAYKKAWYEVQYVREASFSKQEKKASAEANQHSPKKSQKRISDNKIIYLDCAKYKP